MPDKSHRKNQPRHVFDAPTSTGMAKRSITSIFPSRGAILHFRHLRTWSFVASNSVSLNTYRTNHRAWPQEDHHSLDATLYTKNIPASGYAAPVHSALLMSCRRLVQTGPQAALHSDCAIRHSAAIKNAPPNGQSIQM